MKILGVALIVLGVAGLIFGGLTYTSREKVLEVGSFQANVDREKTVPIPPYASAAAVAIGTALLLVNSRRRR
ncbi:MAG: hypothetical protein ACT4TC_23075 [Myxococcaceae bacterium]